MKESNHVILDRPIRYARIQKTIGIGKPVAIAPDRKHKDCFNVLTNTGVCIIQGYDGTMVTLWVASMNQATDIYKRTTGRCELPQKLYDAVKYNNTGARKKYYHIAA